MIWNQKVSKIYSFNINGNIYRNQIDAFSVENLYPQPVFFSADEQTAVSGNVKFNNTFRFSNGFDAQLTAIYLAPDIIPQGKIKSRFSIDLGMKNLFRMEKGKYS